MGDDKEPNSDDDALWRAVTKDVVPLKRGEPETFRADKDLSVEKPRVQAREKEARPSLGVETARVVPPVAWGEARAQPKGRDVDAGTLRKLRAGQIAIDGRLDLHGMNQGEARQALIRTLVAAQAAGKRCVLVITGKGKSRKASQDLFDSAPGVLKRNVPEWLNEAPLRDIVLTAQGAAAKDGGGGALYVYLRRSR
ncbi:MAG: Smr/MutS family protein [Alphaproteobacteria bacterium]